MAEPEIAQIVDLAAVVSDGSPVDWDSAEAQVSDNTERTYVRRLRLVSQIAHYHSLDSAAAAVSWSGRPPALDTSSAAWATRVDGEFTGPVPSEWGPLKVLEPVASGTFGDVYRAWDTRLDREVALKLLRRRESSESADESTVIDEGRLMARVRHPNIVTVYGAERSNQRVGLWMEFIHGRTLQQELREDGPLEVERVARIGIELSRALSAVHEAGLLHRDVKAQNVMRDRDGRVVLGDFGTGRELEEAAAQDTHLAGTPLYLAPEVLAWNPATAASDQYSLGVLLYHLATGTFPVRGRTVHEIQAAHEQQNRVALAECLADAPRQLTDIIDRALESDPTRRFKSVVELGHALTEYLDSQSADLVSPAVGGTATSAWPARIPRLALWLAVAAAGSLVAATATLWPTETRNPLAGRGERATPAAFAVGPVTRQLTEAPCHGAPSADGQWIACKENRMGRGNEPPASLVVFNTDTLDQRVLVSPREGEYIGGAVISPYGDRVVYTLGVSDRPLEIRHLRLADGHKRLLAYLPPDATDLTFGQWAAADGLIGGRIWRSDGSGGTRAGVARNRYHRAGHRGWRPDKRLLALTGREVSCL